MRITFVAMGAENLGVEYLSSVLKSNGHKTSLAYDPAIFGDMGFVNVPSLNRLLNYREVLLEKMERQRPDAVAFSVLTNNYQWALGLAREVKARLGVPVIFGGIHPTLVPDRVIRNGFIDAVVIGEGEGALSEMADSLERRGTIVAPGIKNVWFRSGSGHVVKNPLGPPIKDLDSLPFPDKDLFYEHVPVFKEAYFTMTSRGCPFGCAYCSNNFLKRLPGYGSVRRRSVGNVISELELAVGKYGPKSVLIDDDVFTSDIVWLKAFLRRYKKRIGLPFFCLTHPAAIKTSTAIMLKQSGCYRVQLGIQSVSEASRRRLNRFETNAQITRAILAFKKAGISLDLDHILGLPYESEEEQVAAARFYNRVRPANINAFNLQYFPRTRILEISREAGIITDRDMELIEEGLFGSGYFSGGSLSESQKRTFSSFGGLFAILPVLPQPVVDAIIDKKLYRHFAPFSRFLSYAGTLLSAHLNKNLGVMRYVRYYLYALPKAVGEKVRLKLALTLRRVLHHVYLDA